MDFKHFYLTEMPHGRDGSKGYVDFKLEKPEWNLLMIDLVKNTDDVKSLLNPFYTFGYGKILKQKFDSLSDEEKTELLEILPDFFKEDMKLKK